MKKRISSIDVAREAGVSRATVSYVLNNVEGIKLKDETRQKVTEAAKKLGYFPDSTAQALKINKSMSIGIVSRRKISEHRFVSVLGGIKPILAQNGYSIVLCSDEEDDKGYPEYYRFYKGKKIDGIMFLAVQEQLQLEAIDERVELMLKENIPSVFIDYNINNPLVNCVDINYFQGAYMVTEYLINKGHKDIALLIPKSNTEQEKQRMKGVRKAADRDDVTLTVYEELYLEDFQNVIDKVILSSSHTAVICAWANLAFQVLYTANKNAVKIPDNIAVAALAGNGFENMSFPKLTTSDLSLNELGSNSAELLVNTLNTSSGPSNIKTPCILKVREST